jgi:hypothetical protein
LAVLAGLCSCRWPAGPEAPGGPAEPTVRRATWWNFYERGLLYSLRGEWQKAGDDFERAIGIRRGAIFGQPQEKRRAKTYGLHFVDAYFPHRELGICLYHLGRLDDAEKELLKSVEMLPSSRALFYLNRVRQDRLLRGQAPPTPRPGVVPISAELPTGVVWSRSLALTVRGQATSPNRISEVTINGKPVLIELAQPDVHFSRRVVLAAAEQELRLTARDLAGNEAAWQATVKVDLHGPTVLVLRPPSQARGTCVVVVRDDLGLAGVEVNGRALALTPGQREVEALVNYAGRTVLRVSAVDQAGNRSNYEAPIAAIDKLGLGRDRRRRGIMLADAGLAMPASRRKSGGLPRAPGGAGPSVSDSRAAGPLLAAKPGGAEADTMPPSLVLSPAVPDSIAVTADSYCVDLRIEDGGGIETVVIEVNGQREPQALGGRRPAVSLLTRTCPLNPGVNRLRFEARDAAGNAVSRTLMVERRESVLWRQKLRVTVQLLPPRQKEDAPELRRADLYALLTEALCEPPARLNLLQHDPETMQWLLLEQKISESGLSGYQHGVKAGRLKPAEWLLDGSLNAWSGKDNYDLTLRFIEVDTGEIILTTDIHFTGFSQDHVRLRLAALVDKIEQLLPRVSAPVAKVLSSGVKLPLGRHDMVVPGMRFFFVSGASPDPEGAEPSEMQGAMIQARVSETREKDCLAEPLNPAWREGFREKDLD